LLRLLAPEPRGPLVQRLESGAQHVVEGCVVVARVFRSGLGDEPSAACGPGRPGAGGEQRRLGTAAAAVRSVAPPNMSAHSTLAKMLPTAMIRSPSQTAYCRQFGLPTSDAAMAIISCVVNPKVVIMTVAHSCAWCDSTRPTRRPGSSAAMPSAADSAASVSHPSLTKRLPSVRLSLPAIDAQSAGSSGGAIMNATWAHPARGKSRRPAPGCPR